MDSEGRSCDPVTILTPLEAQNKIADVGGYSYLSSLMDAYHVTSDPLDYARLVRDAYQSRQIVDAMRALHEQIQAGAKPGAIYDSAQKIARLAEPSTSGPSMLSIAKSLEYLTKYHDLQIEAVQKSVNGLCVPTPFNELNIILGGGLRGGRRPVVLAAQEKVGKSQLGLMFLLHAAMQGIPSVLFSLEMPQIQVVARLVGLISNVNPDAILDWVGLDKHEQQRVCAAMEQLYQLPIYVDGRVDWRLAGYRAQNADTIDSMKGRIDKLREQGVEPGLVVVDHLRKVRNGINDERARIVAVSEEFQRWSTSVTFPVVEVVHLLSREGNTSEEPSSRMIFGSSQVAQDASLVLIIDRPPQRMNSAKRAQLSEYELEEAHLIIDIEENGKTGRIPLRFQKSNGSFHEIDVVPRYDRYAAPQNSEPDAYDLQGIRWEGEQ